MYVAIMLRKLINVACMGFQHVGFQLATRVLFAMTMA